MIGAELLGVVSDTVIEKSGSDVVAVPSLTEMRMLLWVPTSPSVG